MHLFLRKWIPFVIAAAALSSAQSFAAGARTSYATSADSSHPFGLGVILGEPSGISGKYWLDNRAAIDGALAFSFDNYFMLYSDYLYHFPGAFGHSNEFVSRLTPYIGIGVMLLVETEDTGAKGRTYFQSNQGSAGLGVRIPLGMEWRPADPHLGVFAELAPGLGIVPATFGFLQGGIGIRYYF